MGRYALSLKAFAAGALLAAATTFNVAAQGPFSAQIQQFYQFLLTAPQSVTGTWTFQNVVINGTCTGSGCGGGGGGTPASPDTSVQFNNGGSFGGSASLTWDGTTLLGNSFVTAATDTGATYQGSPTKALIQSQSDASWGFAMTNAAKDPAHYGLGAHISTNGVTTLNGGKDSEVLLAMVAADSYGGGDAASYNGSLSTNVDFVPWNPVMNRTIGRPSNAWAAVYANTYRGQSTGTTIESYQQPPSTPADPVLAGAGAGNVNNGTHRYVFTFSDSDGHETSPSVPTGAVTVTDNTTNGKVTVTVPYACDTLLPNQNIYRDFNGDGVFKLAHAGAFDCMSTWEDNVANADLGATAPTTSTALLQFTFAGDMLIPPFSSDWGGRTVFLPSDYSEWIEMADTVSGDAQQLAMFGSYAHTGNGGRVWINGGAAGASGKAGGDLRIFGGGSRLGNGGHLDLRGGVSFSGGTGGDVLISSGQGLSGGNPGQIHLEIGTTDRLNIIGDRMTGDVDFDLASHFQQFTEISAPSAPSANQGRLFLQDNGAGKSQLCVRFNTGAAQCFATEP